MREDWVRLTSRQTLDNRQEQSARAYGRRSLGFREGQLPLGHRPAEGVPRRRLTQLCARLASALESPGAAHRTPLFLTCAPARDPYR